MWLQRVCLHLEGHAHLVVEGAQVDLDHSIDEGALVDVILSRLLEHAEKAIRDYTRQLHVLKKGHLVDEVQLVVRLLGLVTPHGQVLEQGLEVG